MAAEQPVTIAGVAQSVEHLFCKQAVRGSSPLPSSNRAETSARQVGLVGRAAQGPNKFFGGFPEWPMGAGCKPAGFCLRWFESNTLHQPGGSRQRRGPQATQTDDQGPMPSTSTSLTAHEGSALRAGLERVRAPSGVVRSGSGGCRARFPAGVAQLVERQPSKLNVASSSLVSRSVIFLDFGRPNPKSGDLLASGRARKGSGGSTSESGDLLGSGRVRKGSGGSTPESEDLLGFGSYSAHLAQLVEHVLGKDEVTSSILVVGSKRLGRVFSLSVADTSPRVGKLPRVVLALYPSASSPLAGRARARAFRFAAAA
jgi:hypothetical protein